MATIAVFLSHPLRRCGDAYPTVSTLRKSFKNPDEIRASLLKIKRTISVSRNEKSHVKIIMNSRKIEDGEFDLQIYPPPYASWYEIEEETPCETAGMTAERKMEQWEEKAYKGK